jgi:hypothetical protein
MCGDYKKETFTKVDRNGGVYTRTKITSDAGTYECENYTTRESVYAMFGNYNDEMCRSSLKKMVEAYKDYTETQEWD